MKKVFTVISIALLPVIFASCGGQKKSSENQDVNSGSQVSNPSSSDSNADKKTTQDINRGSSNAMQAATKDSADESFVGSQLVVNAANRLITRLNLSVDQENKLKDILTKAFVAAGEDLNKKYTVEQSRTIGRDIIQKSMNPISDILDAKQKEEFQKFGHR